MGKSHDPRKLRERLTAGPQGWAGHLSLAELLKAPLEVTSFLYSFRLRLRAKPRSE